MRRVEPSPPLPAAISHEVWLRRLAGAFLVGLGLLIGLTFRDYGPSWDEALQRTYGEDAVRWYATLGRDQSVLELRNLYLYGAFFELVAQLAGWLLPFGLYENRHLVTALFGLLAVGATWLIGRRLGGELCGLLAALFLTATPVFYGHMFFNPKDTPFAALFALGVSCLYRSYDRLPRPGLGLLVATGLVVGLAAGVRVGGLMLLGFQLLLWSGWLAARAILRGPADPVALVPLLRRLGRSFLTVALVAWSVMILVWPWAQLDPFSNPLTAAAALSKFSEMQIPVFFQGQYWPATELPRTYGLTWYAIALPEFYLLAFAVGLVVLLRGATSLKTRLTRDPDPLVKVAALVCLAVFPVAYAALSGAVLYDGLRHFLFTLPLLAVLCATAVVGALRALSSRLARSLLAAAVVASLAVTILDMVELHPYEYVYVNRTIGGGLRAASARFETDYWALAYKEGVEWVLANYEPRSPGRVGVASCAQGFQAEYFLNKTEAAQQRFVPANARTAQVFLATTRANCRPPASGRVVHVVSRMDTPLLYVLELPR